MTYSEIIELIGYACGIGAGNPGCSQGPAHMRESPLLTPLNKNLHWQAILTALEDQNKGLEALTDITKISTELAKLTATLVSQNKFFITVGGDHSSAIGTWSGVATALEPLSLGLLWIDAHLDSHTDQTTPSGNIHGMPLAALLGYGNKSLTNIMSAHPKLLPQNVCVLGVRSYEKAEQQLLEDLKVRIYYMEEIKARGLDRVLVEAHAIISHETHFFGISLDLDAINPSEAPGVGTPEEDGISQKDLLSDLKILLQDRKLIGAEIVEFNPGKDIGQKTETLIANLIKQVIEARSQGESDEPKRQFSY